jgi:hypothetical protein
MTWLLGGGLTADGLVSAHWVAKSALSIRAGSKKLSLCTEPKVSDFFKGRVSGWIVEFVRIVVRVLLSCDIGFLGIVLVLPTVKGLCAGTGGLPCVMVLDGEGDLIRPSREFCEVQE